MVYAKLRRDPVVREADGGIRVMDNEQANY